MTDIEQIISELRGIKEAQTEQRDDIKELSKAFGKLAVQNEQIGNLQNQQAVIWDRMDKLRDYQAGCPREQIAKLDKQQTKTLANQWTAIKLLAGAMLTGFGIMAAFMKVV